MPGEKRDLKIAIDGPAGAGKSTVAREVAHRLGLKYLDTGAMYRAITLKIIKENISLSNLNALEHILNNTVIKIDDHNRVFLDGEEVTEDIRHSRVNDLVSPVSSISIVRRNLVKMQQEIAYRTGGIVMEGRDIASRVLPDADFKFYLDASLEERSRRRRKEQVAKGLDQDQSLVAAEIKNRDLIDSSREDSPLTVVHDAIIIDTTTMPFEAVVEKIICTVAESCS